MDDSKQNTTFARALRDWTAQRRADAESLATANRVQLALSAAEIVGTWDWDVAGGRLHADERLTRIYPIQPETTGAGVSSADFVRFIHHGDRARVRRRLIRALRTAGEFVDEFRVVHPDGSMRWVFAIGRCYGTTDGTPLRFPGVAIDVTDRKQAEEERRENDIRVRLAIEAAEIGTFDYDLLTGELRWDARCRELFGVPPDAPVSYERTFLAGLHPDDRAATDKAVRAAISDPGAPLFDVEYRTVGIADGVVRWIAAKGRQLLVDGRAVRFFGTVRDITARKNAVERLRQAEERYRLAARATNDAIWDWDLTTGEVLWNEAFQRLFGYDAAAVALIVGWWKEQIHPEDRDAVTRSIAAVIDGDGEHWTDEYRFRRADGRYAFVLDRGYVIRDTRGRAVRMIGAMLDITERKRAEEQQKLLAGELQHRVKNTLAMVQAIATQTMRDAATLDEARVSFRARLAALGQAHDVLTRTSWAGSPIAATVTSTLKPYLQDPRPGGGQGGGGRGGGERGVGGWAGGGRIRYGGPDVQLEPRVSLALALALHELATNAVKYGALSNEHGHVELFWERFGPPGAERCRLRWSEHGGPPVTPPSRRSFGSRLIERSFSAEREGRTTLAFDPSGVVCTIEWLLDDPA